MKNATAEKLAQFAIDTSSSVSDRCADLARARLACANGAAGMALAAKGLDGGACRRRGLARQ
jgi:hypothetical protein